MSRQWQNEGGSFVNEENSRQWQDEGGSFINADTSYVLRSAQIPGGTFINVIDNQFQRQIPGYQYYIEDIFTPSGLIRRIIII